MSGPAEAGPAVDVGGPAVTDPPPAGPGDLAVAFTGTRTGLAPLTWGQRAIWHAIGRTVPNDHYFNLGRVLPLADRGAPVDVPRFAEAVAALLTRHEALRTRLVLDEDGEPRQHLFAGGEIGVTVHDEPDPARAGQAAEDLLAVLAGRRFDYTQEWPVRIGAVRSGDRITHAVLALCHLASDGHGAEVLLRDLRMLVLRGSAGRPCADTPFDLAPELRISEAGERTLELLADLSRHIDEVGAALSELDDVHDLADAAAQMVTGPYNPLDALQALFQRAGDTVRRASGSGVGHGELAVWFYECAQQMADIVRAAGSVAHTPRPGAA
ncbi:condensation domain-containing protein, partial [Kitasatospora sp. NPDC001574]